LEIEVWSGTVHVSDCTSQLSVQVTVTSDAGYINLPPDRAAGESLLLAGEVLLAGWPRATPRQIPASTVNRPIKVSGWMLVYEFLRPHGVA
jgi:hypothetical protein